MEGSYNIREHEARLYFFTLQCKGAGFGEENMKYENFQEIQNSMQAVTINSEFSLPGLNYYWWVLNLAIF